MIRTSVLLAIVTSLVVAVLAQAQTTKRAYRVAWVGPTPLAEVSPYFNAFRDGMRQRGYVEGENISYERRFAEPSPERLRGGMDELIRLNVDVIVTVGQPTVQAAQQATTTIPIVMFAVGDPVATGTIASLARPGGNITGLTQYSPELSGKRLQLLKEILPRISRVAVLWNPTNPSNAQQIKVIQGVAEKLAIELQLLEVRTPQHLEDALGAGARGRAEALLTLDDPLILIQRDQIMDLAAKYRLPAAYGWRQFPEAGGMMSYSADFVDMAARAAAFVDKILKGAKPADMPVEQPTKFSLVINLRTAKTLGLTVPDKVLALADEVIE